ncbi:deoxyribodipyrimidine photo-lyase, partial [Pseudohaliea rubra]|uniref:deoxyribodipyrimidine photo-lyase n=1 Tax=Pseudohaliea rubra TaxID=475795 RepID=UPI0005569547
MRRLYWFQNDLRLADNPGLTAAAEGDQLLLLYLRPRQRPWCHQHSLGPQRERFLVECVRALREELAAFGQELLVLDGSPELVIPQLVEQLRIDRVDMTRTPGAYEDAAVARLQRTLPIPVQVHQANTLFAERSLPFPLAALPPQFTPFRRAVEAVAPLAPLPVPATLPPP